MAIINFRFVICICYWQFAIENQKSEIGIGNSKSAIGKLTSFGLKEKTAVVMFPSGRLIVSIPRGWTDIWDVPCTITIAYECCNWLNGQTIKFWLIYHFEFRKLGNQFKSQKVLSISLSFVKGPENRYVLKILKLALPDPLVVVEAMVQVIVKTPLDWHTCCTSALTVNTIRCMPAMQRCMKTGPRHCEWWTLSTTVGLTVMLWSCTNWSPTRTTLGVGASALTSATC